MSPIVRSLVQSLLQVKSPQTNITIYEIKRLMHKILLQIQFDIFFYTFDSSLRVAIGGLDAGL